MALLVVVGRIVRASENDELAASPQYGESAHQRNASSFAESLKAGVKSIGTLFDAKNPKAFLLRRIKKVSA
jgi:hypothetical protein